MAFVKQMALVALWGLVALLVGATAVVQVRTASLFAPSEQRELAEFISKAMVTLSLVSMAAYLGRRRGRFSSPIFASLTGVAVLLVAVNNFGAKFAAPYPVDHPDVAEVTRGCMDRCDHAGIDSKGAIECRAQCDCVFRAWMSQHGRVEVMDTIKAVAAAERSGRLDDTTVEAFLRDIGEAAATCGSSGASGG